MGRGEGGRERVMLCERESLRGVEAALNANNGEGSQKGRSSVSRGVKREASFTRERTYRNLRTRHVDNRATHLPALRLRPLQSILTPTV